MSAPRRPRLRPELRALLEGSGLDWRLEHGKRHWKLFINERLAGIVPMSGLYRDMYHPGKNQLAQVRRHIREFSR